jgi:hypothetical protein
MPNPVFGRTISPPANSFGIALFLTETVNESVTLTLQVRCTNGLGQLPTVLSLVQAVAPSSPFTLNLSGPLTLSNPDYEIAEAAGLLFPAFLDPTSLDATDPYFDLNAGGAPKTLIPVDVILSASSAVSLSVSGGSFTAIRTSGGW